MECPHLETNVNVAPSSMFDQKTSKIFTCSVCKTDKSPWVCLECGVISCGRYVNGHAKDHHAAMGTHMVSMNCDNYSTFCYICDEFVINDTKTGHLDQLRKQLQSLEPCSTENLDHKRARHRRRPSLRATKRRRTDKSKTNKPRSSGLRNLGNTCFMNAVLQSLSNIQQFSGYIKQLPSLDDQKQAKKRKPVLPATTRKQLTNGEHVFLVEELRKTLLALWQGGKAAISPESLFTVIWRVVPRFRGYQQQDAHEFMRYLLDRLHTELLSLLPYCTHDSPYINMGPKGRSTIVTGIFGGLLQSEVNCLVCRVESKKHDPFLDLSLDIPSQFASKAGRPKDGEPVCTLQDCLSSFTELEELEDSELYMCSNCKKRQRSTKKFWIRRLPNVLCLHLKRFRWSSFFRVKLETYVEFPQRGMDMSKYLLSNLPETRGNSTGSNEYDLAAVIVHHGSGAGSGHYTSYATHEGRWYHFNDSSVTACDEATVLKSKAYILFYIRRQLNLPQYLTTPTLNGHL